MRVKKFFLSQAERISAAKEIRCGEFITGCPHVSRGRTEEELMRAIREHAREAHGMAELDDALRTDLLRAIRER